jgi:hypothetical protein
LAAIASPILGGTGALVIGGVAFPPLGKTQIEWFDFIN